MKKLIAIASMSFILIGGVNANFIQGECVGALTNGICIVTSA